MDTQRTRVEIVEPWRAGQYDPPMQEWLQLPAADSCPEDSAHEHWGTRNPRGYFLVRYCKRCHAQFRPEVDARLIAEIAGALVGTPRRFIREYLDKEE